MADNVGFEQRRGLELLQVLNIEAKFQKNGSVVGLRWQLRSNMWFDKGTLQQIGAREEESPRRIAMRDILAYLVNKRSQLLSPPSKPRLLTGVVEIERSILKDVPSSLRRLGFGGGQKRRDRFCVISPVTIG